MQTMTVDPGESGQQQGGQQAKVGTQAGDVRAMSFEDALTELETIVRRLEGGQSRLEDAIEAYERGATLRRHCERKLAEAEAKVQAIVEAPDGGAARLRDVGADAGEAG